MIASEVVVVGGGPAAAAFALTLLTHRPSTRIVIVERGRHAQEKVGESLPPIAGSLLRQLGVWESFLAAGHRPAHGTAAAWGGPRAIANEFVYGVHGCGWHLDRRRFDHDLLAHAVERGAELLLETRLVAAASRRPVAPGWELELDGPAGRSRLETELVIDASGRTASFARRHGGAIERGDRLLALIGRMALERPLPDSYTLVEARPEGWCYSVELPGRRLLVALMTDADIVRALELREPKRWLEWLCGGELTAARLVHATLDGRGAISVVAAGSQRLRSAVGQDWLAIGDAASCYDPLSSQGLVKALRSGIFGAYATLDRFAGRPDGARRHAELIAREFEFYREKHRELHAREQRWPKQEFWRRRTL